MARDDVSAPAARGPVRRFILVIIVCMGVAIGLLLHRRRN